MDMNREKKQSKGIECSPTSLAPEWRRAASILQGNMSLAKSIEFPKHNISVATLLRLFEEKGLPSLI